jgi:hypothetical protein
MIHQETATKFHGERVILWQSVEAGSAAAKSSSPSTYEPMPTEATVSARARRSG